MTKAHNPWVTVKAPETVASASAVLNAKEASVFINTSERTLFSLTASGDIPCVRFGTGKKKPPRYLRSDLEAFLNSHRVTATKEEGGVQ